MKNIILSFLFFVFLFQTSVFSESTTTNSNFAKGGDISWLPQMEVSGYKFLNAQGVQEECFKILKDHGINTIRLRTFVNERGEQRSDQCGRHPHRHRIV